MNRPLQIAPAPLFRDPITDGAADPVLVWNRQEKSWWMLYTQRRANVPSADVAYCYGTKIGIASSFNNGASFEYRGTLDLEFERGHNTFWAPDVVWDGSKYHMYVSYVPTVRNHWGGQKYMAHYSSENLWDWEFLGHLQLSSENVIDATLIQMPEGHWMMWYKDENAGSLTMAARSDDLHHWEWEKEPVIGGDPHEGPKVFRYKGYYWMLTDEWAGMRVYRSDDAQNWEKQGRVLDVPGTRPQDTPTGAHGDVIVSGENAYVVYFTHPGRKTHFGDKMGENGSYSFEEKWSLLQVAPLKFDGETLRCERDEAFDFWLGDVE